ncbi:MAG TPA: aldo/keto reductase [Aggregatilinea sp.]|uniref:aldo/keto reductase n=1 Tax=Aggregatilinea sp. TaxID=2806333 RepID=UPI002C0191D1|nr:aldo/keto reductase [Aggregatilinea sp.]HML22411.1 aldo/keto reductase [Aggregatilinea sp.]
MYPFDGIEMGLGTWSWGDSWYWGYGRTHTSQDVDEAFQAALDAGIVLFDTAEVYGRGESERLLGRLVKQANQPVRIATKFMPFPWRVQAGSLTKALRASLERLQVDQVDLYQIHAPLPFRSVETWMDAMADAVEQGLTRAVGVSNYNLEQTQRAHQALARRGIPLASNQVEYHLLERGPERSGLLDFCQANGIALIAYSPLGGGLLTGKYTARVAPSSLVRRLRTWRTRRKIGPLVAHLHTIGAAHGKTPAQVALNWVICKGALPIPGAKNARQASQDAGGTGWRLTPDEVAALDRASDALN